MPKIICDHCGEPSPQNHINLTRTPNDEPIYAELCGVCLEDIFCLASRAHKEAINKKYAETPKERLSDTWPEVKK